MSIYLVQRTNRHIVKKLELVRGSYIFTGIKFGDYQQIKPGISGLSFPSGITTDGTHIYVCDAQKLQFSSLQTRRIVQLNSYLEYESECDISIIGEPFAIFYDQNSSSLYVSGIYNNRTISLAQISVSPLAIVKYNQNVGYSKQKIPYNLSRGYISDTLILTGFNYPLKVVETIGGFNTAIPFVITGETEATYRGHVKHSNGFIYLTAQLSNKSFLMKTNITYTNIGDSELISKQCTFLTEGLNKTFLAFDNANKRILRFDENMNFLETVFQETGNNIDTNIFDVSGILEL